MFGQLRSRVEYQVGRLMTAGRVALAVYRDEDQGVDSDLFDSYASRMGRYRLNTLYAEGKQYRPANLLRAGDRYTKRYRHTRNIYNFVSRVIDLEVNKVYGGRIDWPGDLHGGAIPIEPDANASPMLITSLKQILKWSNFGRQKDLYVRNGSRLGDSFLKVIPVFDLKEDDDGKQSITWSKVRIEVLDPHKVKDVQHNEAGDLTFIHIEYEDIGDDGKPFTYGEKITKFDIAIFRGDEEVSRVPNTYGFVPATHALHKNIGRKWGVTSFYTTLEKIDEINDVASNTNDGIRRGSNPLIVTVGGKMSQPDAEMRERDSLLVVELPKTDMSVETVTPSIDIMGSIAAQDKMTSEAEADVPQTSLQRIREKSGDMSGVAIENSYTDASDAIEAIQGNYDEPLLRALQMACTIGGIIGLEDFPYDIDSYENGELDFYIKERRVFSDRLAPLDRARLILEAAQSPAWPIIARDLEVSDEDIALVMADAQERQAAQAAAAIRGLAQGFNMDEEDEGDEDEEIVETAE
jgi:hypothetical protein